MRYLPRYIPKDFSKEDFKKELQHLSLTNLNFLYKQIIKASDHLYQAYKIFDNIDQMNNSFDHNEALRSFRKDLLNNIGTDMHMYADAIKEVIKYK